MIRIIYVFTLFLISACCNNENQITNLIEENQILRDSIAKIYEQERDAMYQAMVSVQNPVIKLGEEYIASIGLTVVRELNPTPVIIYNNLDEMKVIDTLKIDEDYGWPKYRTQPSKLGIHTWCGAIIQKTKAGMRHYPFEVEYTVK